MSDLSRSVALQEEKFIAFKDGLEHCLGRYHKVLAALSHAEVSGPSTCQTFLTFTSLFSVDGASGGPYSHSAAGA